MNHRWIKHRLAWVAVSSCVVIGASRAPAGDSTAAVLRVDGAAAARPISLSSESLRTQFADQLKSVDFDSRGEHHTATAVPLITVLQAAGVPTGMQPPAASGSVRDKHRPMRVVIEASADDGYAVVFSLAELLPDVGHEPVWLMLDKDGHPLPDKELPVDLLVPADTKPARWVHGVTHITASDYAPATTQP